MKRCLIFIAIFIFSIPLLFLCQSNKPFDIDTTQIALFFGAYFYDVPADSRVEEVRCLEERKKIAVSVRYKEKDTLKYKYVVMNPDGTGRELITSERFFEFPKPARPELNQSIEKRLKEFTVKKFKPHIGILGGVVRYGIVIWEYSPDKGKIAFMIKGEDGHCDDFYPSLYVSDHRGRNITRIDSTFDDMCKDVIWLSSSEILYVKDSRLWEAVIR